MSTPVSSPMEEEVATKGQAVPEEKAQSQEPSVEEESETEDDSDPDEEEGDDDMFAGLTAEQKAKMKAKMKTVKAGFKSHLEDQKNKEIFKVRKIFELYVDCPNLTDEECAFTADFCTNHGIDISEKVETEGVLFLRLMREMKDSKDTAPTKSKKKRTSTESKDDPDDSASEYELDNEEQKQLEETKKRRPRPKKKRQPRPPKASSSSQTALGAKPEGEWQKEVVKRKNERANDPRNLERKYGFRLDGTKRAGRILLDDALKDKVSMTGWSEARKKAFKQIAKNPNAYYYRFNKPGEPAVRAGFTKEEQKLFMKTLKKKGANSKWGDFSIDIPGRVGYVCSNYFRKLVKEGSIYDPNYWYDGKKLHFKRLHGKERKDETRVKFSFTVVKDPTGVCSPLPWQHPQRPDDLMTGAEAKRLASLEPSAIAPEGFKKSKQSTAPPSRKRTSSQASRRPKKRRKTETEDSDSDLDVCFATIAASQNHQAGGSDGSDEENLPDFVDPMTNMPIRMPAISPYGHVCEYDTWTKVLRQPGQKDVCPFTKQPLKRRALTKLRPDNFAEFREKILNQDEALKKWEDARQAATKAKAPKKADPGATIPGLDDTVMDADVEE